MSQLFSARAKTVVSLEKMPVNGAVASSSGQSLPALKISGLTEYNSVDPEEAQPSFADIPKSLLLPDGYPDYLRLILTSRVYEITNETQLTFGISLSGKLGVRVMLKREDLHPVFSFKIRGAYNKMANIPEDDRWKGIVACSAGTLTPSHWEKRTPPQTAGNKKEKMRACMCCGDRN